MTALLRVSITVWVLAVVGCVKTQVDPSDAGGPPPDEGPPQVTYDPVLGMPTTGPLMLDDERVRALDPRTLRAGPRACRPPVLARVIASVDGDTFHVAVEGGEPDLDIRIIGVDAPEISHNGQPPDCYGPEAQAFTAQLLGRLVYLTFDGDCTDPYRRTLAYVHLGAGENDFFERQLLLRGLARTLAIQPNTTYAGLFESDLVRAMGSGAGLWTACR